MDAGRADQRPEEQERDAAVRFGLVGVDASPESLATTWEVVELLGERIGLSVRGWGAGSR